MGRDHAGPEAVRLQPPPQRFVEHLLVGQVPEFVTQRGIVLLVTDKDKFQRNRLGRGTRAVRCHGHGRLCGPVGPQRTTAPARGKQGEPDDGGIPYGAVEHDAGDREGGLARRGR